MFTIYSADCTGSAANCLYPHKTEVHSEEDFSRAVSRDYVCAAYKGGYRGNDNYLESNCLAFDVDNESENPEDWVTPEKLRALLPGVRFAVHFSRNHMKEKNGKAPRPKFHVFFPVEPIKDPAAYRAWKQRVWQRFPFFDKGALDAARFFFGTENPSVEIYPGE